MCRYRREQHRGTYQAMRTPIQTRPTSVRLLTIYSKGHLDRMSVWALQLLSLTPLNSSGTG